MRARSRSVYLPLLRGITPRPLEAFDPVDQTLVTGRAQVTTVPGQALYLLNSSFVRRQSLALAERLLDQKATRRRPHSDGLPSGAGPVADGRRGRASAVVPG